MGELVRKYRKYASSEHLMGWGGDGWFYGFDGSEGRIKAIVNALTQRLRERGLGEIAKLIEEKKDWIQIVEAKFGEYKAEIKFDYFHSAPPTWFKMGFLHRWKGEPKFELVVMKPTGNILRSWYVDGYEPFEELKLDTELVGKYMGDKKTKEKLEEALICFMYDMFGEKMFEDWWLYTKEGQDLWNTIKSECGERLLPR
ncbi:MAG: hypothetical protein DRN54_03430 [Thaumarchaeota archaeon]|nr:MAG: hypothetical protein DRN54_03430 [Nitrososphaerota archaeon]